MKQLFVMALEPDGKPVECKVLKILFESDEINIEYPDGNCEWYKLSDFELIEKQLTIEELREQFENNYLYQSCIPTIRTNFPKSIHGKYTFSTDQIKWECYQACAKANGILKGE